MFYILGGNKVAPGGASAGPTAMNKAPSKIGGGAPKVSAGAPIKTQGSSVGAKPSISGSKPSKGGEVDVAKLQQEISDLRLNMDTVEKERDFYFAKLRDIELLLQANPSKSSIVTENILKILYAAEEEKVTIDEAGNLSITPNNGGAGTGGGTGTGDDQMLNDEQMDGGVDDEMADTAEEAKLN